MSQVIWADIGALIGLVVYLYLTKDIYQRIKNDMQKVHADIIVCCALVLFPRWLVGQWTDLNPFVILSAMTVFARLVSFLEHRKVYDFSAKSHFEARSPLSVLLPRGMFTQLVDSITLPEKLQKSVDKILGWDELRDCVFVLTREGLDQQPRLSLSVGFQYSNDMEICYEVNRNANLGTRFRDILLTDFMKKFFGITYNEKDWHIAMGEKPGTVRSIATYPLSEMTFSGKDSIFDDSLAYQVSVNAMQVIDGAPTLVPLVRVHLHGEHLFWQVNFDHLKDLGIFSLGQHFTNRRPDETLSPGFQAVDCQ